MMAKIRALNPTIDSRAPTGSSGDAVLSLECGTSRQPATRAMAMIGRLMRKTAPHQKCSSSSPEVTGPMAAPAAGDAGPDGDRLGPLAPREDVGQDGQRRGHDERRADAHDRSADDDLGRRGGEGADQRAEGEHDQAALQGPLAAEAVAEGTGGEEQAGEDQRVGVDHPLQLGVAGPELVRVGERRQGDVEHRVADDDDDQRGAEDGEDPPAPGVDVADRCRRGRSRCPGRADRHRRVVGRESSSSRPLVRSSRRSGSCCVVSLR